VLAHSLGCAAGLQFALATRYPVNHFVLVSPFSSIPKMAMELFLPRFLHSYPIISTSLDTLIAPRNRWHNIEAVEELAQRMRREQRTANFIVIHGDNDEICPYHQGEEVYNKALQFKSTYKTQFIPVQGGDHNGIMEMASNLIIRAMKARL
jgi:predicted alpha/beta hydrolase family esterase